MAYGASEDEAIRKAKALALRTVADRIEHGEPFPDEAKQLFEAARAPGRRPRRGARLGIPVMVKFNRTRDDGDIISAKGAVRDALKAWHKDRLEWVGHALRSLTLVNAGGAVAVAAYIGARQVTTAAEAPGLIAAIISFSVGLTIMVFYPVYRFLWAEFRVWYLRGTRSRFRDMKKDEGHIEFMEKKPPTRWQLAWTYLACIGSLTCFVYGLWRSIEGLLV